MSQNFASRLLAAVLTCLPMTLYATSSSQVVDGVTQPLDVQIPSQPISTRAQLEAYLSDTPASRSPLNWLTPAAKERFLEGLAFSDRGLGGLSLGDLGYELTREQAYSLLKLFGAQSYALNLDARLAPRPAESSQPAGEIEANFNQLADMINRTRPSPDAVTRFYAEHFSPVQTEARRKLLSDREAAFLYRAAALAFKVNQRPAGVDDLRADFSELQRRDLVDRPQASDLYDALVITGKTAAARSLQRRYPLVERADPPLMRSASRISASKPSLWVLDNERGKREFVRYPFNMRVRSQVIVIGSARCHYSEKAAAAIDADPVLREVFGTSAQWVAPAVEVTAFDAIARWNERYPTARLGVIHDDAELPMVKHFETPTFYFLTRGRVVETVVGWPEGGNLEAIRHGLRAIDLLR